jgi:Fe-S cluster biogenesis protein NfuA
MADDATTEVAAPEPVISGGGVSEAETEKRVQALVDLIELIRPAVQSDGGDLMLVSVDTNDGIVEVMLQGACSSCAVSSSTLKAGIERILKDRLPWITEVNGGIDESVDVEVSAAMGRGGYVPKDY